MPGETDRQPVWGILGQTPTELSVIYPSAVSWEVKKEALLTWGDWPPLGGWEL